MSIESEKGNNINLEKPNSIPRHTHNGIDSVKLKIKEMKSNRAGYDFLDWIGGGTLTGGNASGAGSDIRTQTPPLLETIPVTVGDGSGGTKTIYVIDPLSANNVNLYLRDVNDWLNVTADRVNALFDNFDSNGLADVTEVINTDLNRYPTFGDFPATGTVGEYYADDSTGEIYEWLDDDLHSADYYLSDTGWYSAYKYNI